MTKKKNQAVLMRYFNHGWLDRPYFDGEWFCRPYSAEDRLRAGTLFYGDYLVWLKGNVNAVNYEKPKVDGGMMFAAAPFAEQGERFRRALRRLSKASLGVVYKIVLEEREILVPMGISERERLYFSDEIKRLLCSGLDELCRFYARRRDVRWDEG